MDFKDLNIRQMKIFKSVLTLEYKDSKLESWYQNFLNQNMRRLRNYASEFLLFFGIFLTTLEGVLYFTPGKGPDKNLKWNFYFTMINLIVSIVIFILTHFTDIVSNNKYVKYITQFFIHFAFENFFLSLISILLVYFQLGIEVISFTFFAQTVSKCLLSFFLHRSFINSMLNNSISYSFKVIFLFKIHFIKAIIYYLIVNFAFQSIVLAFVYLYEYMTRKFFYSFLKMAKEKEYFLDTLNFFNISYFASRNRHLKKTIKMDCLLKNVKFDSLKPISLTPIEDLFRNSLVQIDNVPNDVEQYLIKCKRTKTFKFKKLVKILRKKEENKNYFKKFVNFGVLKIPGAKDDTYMQVLLKIKIKNLGNGSVMNSNSCHDIADYSCNTLFEEGLDVKIEGLFVDVTQTYMKKETQVNSFLLAKYIHDIKTPLFLLQQVVDNYKHLIKDKMGLFSNTDKAEQNEFSYNLKILSKHIFEIIQNINNFTKKQNNMSNEMSDSSFSKVDIRKLINRCLDFYRIYSKFNDLKKNIRVYADIEGHVPQFIYSNKMALKHIFMNLLSNAMKFTYHGEIKLVCKLKSKLEISDEIKFIEINIIDTGIGIDEENLKQICRPFSLSTSKNAEGSGLGLCIVKDLLHSLNSKLSIYSVKNKGSNFSFELPVGNKIKDSPCMTGDRVENVVMTEFIDHPQLPTANEIEAVGIDNFNNIVKAEDEDNNRPKEGEYTAENSGNQVDCGSYSDRKTVIYDEPFDIKCLIGSQYKSLATDEEVNISSKTLERLKDHRYMDAGKNSNKSDLNICSNSLMKQRCKFTKGLTEVKKNLSSNNVNSFYNEGNNNININIYNNSGTVRKESKCKICLNRMNSLNTNTNNIGTNDSLSKISKYNLLITEIYDLKIIILDDDPTYVKQIRNQINKLIPEMNIKLYIDTASDPIEGLYKIYFNLKEGNVLYDLVLLDENMPFMKGSMFVKFYKDVLQTNGFYKIPFVSITSEIFSRAEIAGYLDDQLSKPCRKKELRCILEKYMNNHNQF